MLARVVRSRLFGALFLAAALALLVLAGCKGTGFNYH